MGRRGLGLWRWAVIIVAAAAVASSAIFPAEGSSITPSPVPFGYPSPGASRPSQLQNAGSALAPRPDSLPKAFSPMYGAVSPSVHPATPSVLYLAPSAHADTGDKWPRAIAPAIEGQPNAPISSAPVLPSPRQSQPTLSNVPPVAPRMAPNTAFAPRAMYFPGSATPPASVTSPVISSKNNDTPVDSPPIEGSSHLTPANSSSTKCASPTVSHVPEKAQPANASSHTGAPPTLSPIPEKYKPSNNSVSKGPSPMLSPVSEEPNSSNNSASEGSSPMLSPVPNKAKPSDAAHAPLASHLQPPVMIISDGPTTGSPVQRARKEVGNHSSPPTSQLSPPSHLLAPMVTPVPKDNLQHRASPPSNQGHFFPWTEAPAPSQPLPASSESKEWPSHSPTTTPASYVGVSSAVHSPPMWLLPPPPPNLDCKSLVCVEPLINPPPGSPCVCVLPMRVGLRLSVTLYTFFPLVPELAQEIAYGISMNQNQVRIMGANVADEEPEDTVVLIDLVPDNEKFENSVAFSTFNKLWLKYIIINRSLFGDYEVLYVVYPGLPPSPPRAPADSNIGDGAFANSYNARAMKPLGVDISKPKKKVNGNLIAVIVLSSFLALMLCVGAAWYLLLKQRDRSHHARTNLQNLLPLFSNSSGIKHMQLGRLSSETASANSSIAAHTGQAKIFSSAEIERATSRFHETRIIGEGGFGRVYQGTLDDGVEVAVKVLKRDDQQGGREFFSEIEMLSRLHHRNLVKLIGICIEEHIRCLVYELIPNGSLESHLHGMDKETAPLDWSARMKIALGAARGLAYLHEDSSPRVIHRDFKSSNILLEHDYTPKVSDFGLARAAVDGGNLHISTRVMGTFGYVAPEYAMTGHLLVKSDVYSYGVVLLELLTGRKPIDMLQPPGQENLVSWARPLLTNVDCLETIVDPALGANAPLGSAARVAAIASMCVQTEVSHRPFMGEVVQALNLVCHQCNESKGSGSSNRGDSSAQNADATVGNGFDLEAERVLLESYLLSESTSDELGSFRRHTSSGPLTTSKSMQHWQPLSSSTGSMSDAGAALRFATSSYHSEGWSQNTYFRLHQPPESDILKFEI